MGVQLPMSSGSRRNSSNPNVPSGRLKRSTQRSTAAVEGLSNTSQLGSNRLDIDADDTSSEQLSRSAEGPDQRSQWTMNISPYVTRIDPASPTGIAINATLTTSTALGALRGSRSERREW